MSEPKNLKIYFNGNIYIKFNPLAVAESLVVRGETIEFYGRMEQSTSLYGQRADSMIDLGGKTVIPGFVDSHAHLDDLGGTINFLNLRNTRSIREMKEKLSAYSKANSNARVIIGTGWDQEAFDENRWPNRTDLDEVESSRPVYLERFCEHAAVVNSRMLEMFDRADFSENIFPRLADGTGSGLVKEEASEYFKAGALKLADNLKENLVSSTENLVSLGVTTVGFVSCGEDSINILKEMGENLKVRVRAYLRQENAERIEDLRKEIGESSRLKINGIKLFADGALGARTAALRSPYSDDPSNKGMLLLDPASLIDLFERFRGKNVQFAIHAIGDSGIDSVIMAVTSFGRQNLLEPRIEHCSVLRSDQVDALKAASIGISVQPAFVIDDWWIVRRVGKERSALTYPLGSLQRSGIRLGISTDTPVEPPDPWLSVDAAVNRGEREGREILEYSGSERVDLASALYLYTEGSASLLMDESVGSLDPGKFADFVILDEDPFKAQDFRTIGVIETVVGGKTVFKGIQGV